MDKPVGHRPKLVKRTIAGVANKATRRSAECRATWTWDNSIPPCDGDQDAALTAARNAAQAVVWRRSSTSSARFRTGYRADSHSASRFRRDAASRQWKMLRFCGMTKNEAGTPSSCDEKGSTKLGGSLVPTEQEHDATNTTSASLHPVSGFHSELGTLSGETRFVAESSDVVESSLSGFFVIIEFYEENLEEPR
jgi:hypothetical protein